MERGGEEEIKRGRERRFCQAAMYFSRAALTRGFALSCQSCYCHGRCCFGAFLSSEALSCCRGGGGTGGKVFIVCSSFSCLGNSDSQIAVLYEKSVIFYRFVFVSVFLYMDWKKYENDIELELKFKKCILASRSEEGGVGVERSAWWSLF